MLKLAPMRQLKGVFSLLKTIKVCNNVVYRCLASNELKPNQNSPFKTYELNLKVKGISVNNYVVELEKEFSEISQNTTNLKRIQELQPIINILKTRSDLVEILTNLNDILNDKDAEIRKLALEEQQTYEQQLKETDKNLLKALVPIESDDLFNSIILEVNMGIGGQEAMLFAKQLFEMYCKYASFKGWEMEIADYQSSDMGGVRSVSALMHGTNIFQHFKHEAGIHRVQRIPATEKSGRIHTSTVSVIVLPQPSDIEIKLENKDLRVETKRASGAGGQHVNTTDSAVRITHLPTNMSVECQIDRSQIRNKQLALAKLRTLLYENERNKQKTTEDQHRKMQVRTNNRNEKIRTYNFPQDRITDHRIRNGGNIHNLKGFLQGSQDLEGLIKDLDYDYKMELLLNIVSNK